MADETGQAEEWLDFSSSCVENQGKLFEPENTELQTESAKEDLEHNTSVCSKPEEIRELLKQSLPDTTHMRQNQSSPQCASNSSAINESCKHWIWVKLISNLNAVRQPKWLGSCLEECYCRSLQISKELNEREQPQIAFDNSCKDFFNFHGILSTNKEPNRTNKLVKTESVNELINRNGTKHRDSIKSLELPDTAKEELTRSLDDNFEDLDAELEWSDNIVKDDTSLSNASLSSSGINENEATAELVCLPHEEVLRLRNELKEYTKQYSDILVVELKNRDDYIREKELKNVFISSFLSVQEKVRETHAANKKKFSLQSNKSNNPPNSQSTFKNTHPKDRWKGLWLNPWLPFTIVPFYAHIRTVVTTVHSLTTIPYEIKNGGPSTDILEKLIEIMDAMRTNSPNVPTLLTNYILKVLCK